MYDTGGIKEEYIEKYSFVNKGFRKVMTNVFNLCEPVEKNLNKDLCDFTIMEIIGLYKYWNLKSLESLLNYHSQLNRYVSYCRDIGRIQDGINHFEEVTYSMQQSCINTYTLEMSISTREELIKIIDTKIVNYSDKFICLALFEGLGGIGCKDLLNISIEQFNGNKVKLPSGRTLEISKKLFDYADESSRTFEYYSNNGDGKRAQKFQEDTRIIKDVKNVITDDDANQIRRIKNRLVTLEKILDSRKFMYAYLVESGRLHMINEFIKNDGTDAFTAISKHKNEIEYRYGKIYAVKRYVLKYNDFIGKN